MPPGRCARPRRTRSSAGRLGGAASGTLLGRRRGILANGFARVHCDACGKEMLVAFSCRGRGICPSCTTRRMQGTARRSSPRSTPLTSKASMAAGDGASGARWSRVDALIRSSASAGSCKWCLCRRTKRRSTFRSLSKGALLTMRGAGTTAPIRVRPCQNALSGKAPVWNAAGTDAGTGGNRLGSDSPGPVSGLRSKTLNWMGKMIEFLGSPGKV